MVMVQKQVPSLFGDDEPRPEEQPRVAAQASGQIGARRLDGASKTISDLYVSDAVIAIKEATKCDSLDALKERLLQVLSQNSEETRIRNARFVIRWFFPDGIDGVARKTWSAYSDDRILMDVLMDSPANGTSATMSIGI